MRVSELTVYPIKSTSPTGLTRAAVEPWGLVGDRRWALEDGDGVGLTARDEPGLLRIRALLDGDALDLGDLRVAPPAGEPIAFRLFKHHDPLSGVPAGDAADAWFRARLGRPDVRLLWCDDPTRRTLNPAHSTPADSASFADGYPVLLTTTASLRQLNEWIGGEPLPMGRFRPNVVVDGDQAAFAEDSWKRIRIGGVEFRVAQNCGRCVLTTIDADTLARGPEPIRTLARHRRWDGKTWFGVYLIPDGTGELALGDAVEVLD